MLIPIVALVIIVFVALFVLGAQRKRESRKDIYYDRFKEQFQLEFLKNKSSIFVGKTFKLRGEIDNNSFTLEEEIRRMGKRRVYHTVVRFENSPGFDFKIGKENFFTRLGKLIGFKDIEFENHQIDRSYLFKSKNEEKFRAFITDEILYDLGRIKERFNGSIHADSSSLYYEFQGQIMSEEIFEDIEVIIALMRKMIKH